MEEIDEKYLIKTKSYFLYNHKKHISFANHKQKRLFKDVYWLVAKTETILNDKMIKNSKKTYKRIKNIKKRYLKKNYRSVFIKRYEISKDSISYIKGLVHFLDNNLSHHTLETKIV